MPLRDTFNILLTYYNPNYYKVKTREDFDSGRTFPVSATGLIFPLEIPPYPKGQIKKGMIEPKEKVLLEYVEIVNIAADGTVLKSAVIDEMGNFSFLWKFPRVRIS